LKLDTLGLGDKAGLANAVEFEAGLRTRSLGLGDGFAWLLPREAAMMEAVELTPPNLAEGLMAGEGFVASVGEVGASREPDGISVVMKDLSCFDASGLTLLISCFGASGLTLLISCFGASGSTLLASCTTAPRLLFFGPLALPLRTSAKGAPSAGGSLAAAATGLDDAPILTGLSEREPLGEPPLVGGPRARMLARPGLKRAASLLVGAATAGYVSRLSSAGGDAARSPARGRDVVRPRGSVVVSCLRTGDGRRLAGSVTDFVR
jgi:hypothetical protein